MKVGYDLASEKGDEVVKQSKPCEKCGAHFELRYLQKSGEAVQFWPKGCGPGSDCFKRLMPPSDFRAYEGE